MNGCQSLKKYAAAIVICLTFGGISPAVAKSQFRDGAPVACDHRYLWTCDTRGWGKAATKAVPFRNHRHRVHRGDRRSGAAAVERKTDDRRSVRVARAAGKETRSTAVTYPNVFGARPRAWCGWWMALRKGIHERRLWVAREWAHVGRPAAGPAPGVIGVMRHHVYEVVRVVGPGRVLAISGNDGRAVRTRVRSTRGTFAWRYV